MREVTGVLAPGDFPQARWQYNVWFCDDAYDAASQNQTLLLVDAHGWEDPALGWVMELLDSVVVVEEWVRTQPEAVVFLNVCNPGGRMIVPRSGQAVTFSPTIVWGIGTSPFVTVRGEDV